MNKLVKALIVLVLWTPLKSFAQQPDTLLKKLDSLSIKKDTSGNQVNDINQNAYNENTKINFSTYFILLGSDFKQQFTKPFHMSKKDWGYLGKFALLSGALAFADKPVQHFGLNLRNHNTGVRSVSKYVTNFGGAYETYTLAAFGAYGLLFKSEKIKTTTLLASQAYITGAAMESVLKFLTGRNRPYNSDPTAVQATPTFHGPFQKPIKDVNGKKLNSSFPSGHTTVAFAAATVFASEYRDRPLVPFIAYGAATLIGMSRITENKHWITDVVAGAALGYITGKQVVNNYHRYAKLKAPKDKKNTISFNLQYNYGRLMPGVIYTFH